MIVDGMRLGRLGFGRDENEWLAADFGLAPGGAVLTLELAAERKFVPVRAGTSPDVRELGFGLQRVAVR